jgi:hypothetical protein
MSRKMAKQQEQNTYPKVFSLKPEVNLPTLEKLATKEK